MKQIVLSNGAASEAVDCASCVSRRDFLARVGAAAAVLMVAACGGSANDLTGVGGGPLPGGPLTVNIADYPDLATVGQPVELRSSSGRGAGVAAVRMSASTFIALGMACTHQGTKIDIVSQGFVCPNHGSRFASNGAVLNPPANQPLVSRSVTYDATGGTLTVS
ncbi:MAG: ubiquinol-cytochrome c reductase iron-sulfur subunit [Gemmatimonadales bacterium]